MVLSEATKRAKARYHKKWQKENPKKVKEIQIRYWNKKGKELCKEENNDS